MIYKTFQKVSNVCQLLDKSKLPNTQTVNGITYTVDKVNGTITANGTATAESDYKTDIALNNAESYTNGGGTKIPSRLLFLGCPIGGSQTTYGLYNNWISLAVVDTGNGGITDTTSDKYYEYYRFNLRITIKQGYTANNLVFKPQLFDLTEMYGAGNEPTSVEQFRQDFPDEMYDYSPHCFVKSYKTLLKASDYCQLLDKSKFPATQTVNGVTFTNNGDGSININGTATGDIYYWVKRFIDNSLCLSHKYLLTGENSGINIFVENRDKNNNILVPLKHNIINTLPSNTEVSTCECYIKQGAVCDNLVLKPQLFDLTEMYGTGNEPTTVEQFRQDFPEKLYDYKPYSIIPSYKKSLVCKTKNLLPYPYLETTLTRHGITFTDNGDGTITTNGTSVGFATFVFSKNFNFIAGNTYYVSTPYSIIAYKENGTIYYITGNKSFTWSSNWEVVQIYVQINKGITLNNLKIYPMINLGNTATDYVPYGHL